MRSGSLAVNAHVVFVWFRPVELLIVVLVFVKVAAHTSPTSICLPLSIAATVWNRSLLRNVQKAITEPRQRFWIHLRYDSQRSAGRMIAVLIEVVGF